MSRNRYSLPYESGSRLVETRGFVHNLDGARGARFTIHRNPLSLCATCPSFSGDPLANIRIAIHQRDASSFAPGEKIDAVLPRQSHIFQVEKDAAALRFRGDECFQLGDMLCVEPAAYRKNRLPVF